MLRRTTVSWLVLPLLAVGTLTACGDDDSGGAATTAAAGGALPPLIADLNTVDGTTIVATAGAKIDLTGDDSTFTDWTADIADPAVVSFTPGQDDGSAQFNPGLSATAVGTTEVTLTNTTSGETVTFTVEVIAS